MGGSLVGSLPTPILGKPASIDSVWSRFPPVILANFATWRPWREIRSARDGGWATTGGTRL